LRPVGSSRIPAYGLAATAAQAGIGPLPGLGLGTETGNLTAELLGHIGSITRRGDPRA